MLGVNRHPAIVELLVQHNANVNLQTGMTKVSPLGLSAAKVSPASVVKKLVELRADVNGNEAHGGVGHSPLSHLIWSSPALQRKAVKLAAVLVSARADVNAPGCSGGLFRWMEVAYRARLCLGSSSSSCAWYFANTSSGPLGYAALCGHARMVSFLLAAKANPDLRNSRGVTPRQLADIQTQQLFAEHVLNRQEQHLSNRVEDSHECPPREVADSNSQHLFCEESLNSNEWDLPTEWMPKPLQSFSSGSGGSLSSQGLVVVRL